MRMMFSALAAISLMAFAAPAHAFFGAEQPAQSAHRDNVSGVSRDGNTQRRASQTLDSAISGARSINYQRTLQTYNERKAAYELGVAAAKAMDTSPNFTQKQVDAQLARNERMRERMYDSFHELSLSARAKDTAPGRSNGGAGRSSGGSFRTGGDPVNNGNWKDFQRD